MCTRLRKRDKKIKSSFRGIPYLFHKLRRGIFYMCYNALCFVRAIPWAKARTIQRKRTINVVHVTHTPSAVVAAVAILDPIADSFAHVVNRSRHSVSRSWNWMLSTRGLQFRNLSFEALNFLFYKLSGQQAKLSVLFVYLEFVQK